jgi:hypothetical protein
MDLHVPITVEGLGRLGWESDKGDMIYWGLDGLRCLTPVKDTWVLFKNGNKFQKLVTRLDQVFQ